MLEIQAGSILEFVQGLSGTLELIFEEGLRLDDCMIC